MTCEYGKSDRSLLISLVPNNKFLYLFNLNAFADDKNVAQMEYDSERVLNIVGKWESSYKHNILHFLQFYLKHFFLQVVKS